MDNPAIPENSKRRKGGLPTINPVPSTLARYVEEKAGIEKGTLDISTKFNPYTKKSYYDTNAEALFKEYASFDGLANIMADTYQIAVLNISSALSNVSKTKNNKPYTDLYDTACRIITKNVLLAKEGYKVQTTSEARNDFLLLAEQAATSGCEALNEIVNKALDKAFSISVHTHNLFHLFFQ